MAMTSSVAPASDLWRNPAAFHWRLRRLGRSAAPSTDFFAVARLDSSFSIDSAASGFARGFPIWGNSETFEAEFIAKLI